MPLLCCSDCSVCTVYYTPVVVLTCLNSYLFAHKDFFVFFQTSLLSKSFSSCCCPLAVTKSLTDDPSQAIVQIYV